jgi:hypothetical protein
MKRLLFILVMLCLMVPPLEAVPNRIIISDNFLRRFDEGGQNPAIVLVYGQRHRYIKIFKKTVIVDGIEYKRVHATVSPLGRVWHVNLILRK